LRKQNANLETRHEADKKRTATDLFSKARTIEINLRICGRNAVGKTGQSCSG
jgi:hypothetical protein